MVLTNNPEEAEHLRALRNLCFQKARRFYHTELGNNYRLTNVQAAIGLAQFSRIEETIAKKRWMAQAYIDRLRSIHALQLPVEKAWAKNVYWMFGLVLDEVTGLNAGTLARQLADKGIITRPFFLGMHEQPVFHQMGLFQDEHYPVAERLARQGLYLPSGLTITEPQIERVCQALGEVLS